MLSTFVLLGSTLGVRAGDTAMHSVPSATLGSNMDVVVYTPDGDAPAEGWPVLYLLHGHNGSARSWTALGHIRSTLDRMIGEREIAPILVVMPDAANSWYVDSADVGGPGDYETALTKDLPKWVEAAFPVRKNREGRAIAGLSMGGYGALRLALGHPDRYVAAASLSGGLWQNVPAAQLHLPPRKIQLIADSSYFHRVDPYTIDTNPVLPNLESHFAGAFGTPFDPRLFNSRNVFTLLSRWVADVSVLPSLYVTVGDDDSHQLWRGAFAFFETMKADRRKVELRVTPGDHVWSLWAVSIIDVLKFVDGHVADPSASRAPRSGASSPTR